MDFGTLLHVAKKNSETSKNEGKFYSTKFAPPKKVSKEKKLSDNIQKFLQKREQEERERQQQHNEKVGALLAMRDEKSKNKIRKMLKVTKSANKSVLDDAVSDVTMNRPMNADQPDQDDYGYVSVEANAFYAKYIEKVKDVKEDKGFAPSRPQSLRDLSGTKERVKAAITREIEEKKTHTRQRTSTVTSSSSSPSSSKDPSSATSSKTLYDPETERREEERRKREEKAKKAKARRPAPPPMDFQALLKLAEKKQHEPVSVLQPDVKGKKEPERLLTMKEKREAEERQRWKDERAKRDRDRAEAAKRESGGAVAPSTPGKMEPNGRIPKLNQAAKTNNSATPAPAASASRAANSASGTTALLKVPARSSSPKGGNGFKKPQATSVTASTATKSALSAKGATPSSSLSSAAVAKSHTASSSSGTLTKSSSSSAKPSSASALPSSSKNPYNGATREFPPRDLKSVKARQFPPPDVQKTRQFPPADVRRRVGPSGRPLDNRRPPQPQANKKRILDDDDEDDYDSELDDFIDDGDCGEDYSSHIKSIFGYDKSKYRHLDEEDDAAMETNFAQQQREEYLSKKAGMQEDLEDMKLEAMQKKRKMVKKRRLLDDDDDD